MRTRDRLFAMLTATTLVLVVAGAAAADSSGGCSTAACTLTTGQIDFQAGDGTPVQATVTFSVDPIGGTMSGDIGYNGFAPCQVDGGNPDEILFNGDAGGPATISIGKNLGSLVATGTFTGSERMQNGCTGADVTTTLTFKVSAKLTATGLGQKTHSRTVIHNPDGTKTINVYDDHQRPIAGNVKVNKVSYALSNGLIDQFTFTSTTR